MAVALTKAAGKLLGTLLITASAAQDDGPFLAASVGLYTSGPAIGPSMLFADFTPAAFTGYAAKTAQPWGPPYVDQEGKIQLASALQQFVCTTAGDPNVCRGFYVWAPGPPQVLLLAGEFDTPITITDADDGVAFSITIEFDLNDHGTYLFAP